MTFNFSDIFWLFIIFSMLSPLFQKWSLENRRLRAFRRLEEKRKSRVISLIHRQETMSILGFPLMKYIDIHDSEEVIRAIKITDKEIPIDLILHTPGGLVLAAEQIALALKNHPAKVTVFIPHYAMSGGTMIALAADEIVMSENSVLGPVDPQLGEYPAASVLKVLTKKDINKIDDRTLILADVSEKAIKQVREFVFQLVEDKMEKKKALELATILTEGRWTHDYPITLNEAQKLGLPVSNKMPPEVEQLISLYPQPGLKRPSVQYIPVPYRPDTHPRKSNSQK
ncbi:MAG: hypothetical protein B5M54_03550 [Candidatus Aminicenantes bacterium 4484_214]|nr:MAG: hypothetical protein B5M54_03550 [Candidatus Aminicenantes bacterium 4484_214]